MSHISVRPISDDEFDLLQSLFNLAISGPNQGIAKVSSTTFENRTFGSGSSFTLTTNGTSGVATYTSGVLNIPNYTSSGNPGGSNTSIQFNDSGVFNGFGTWDGVTAAYTNLNITGILGSILPPTDLAVSYDYAPILPSTNIILTGVPGGGYSYSSQEFDIQSPDIPITFYTYVDNGDFTTWSSTSVIYNFPSPPPTGGLQEITEVTTADDILGSLNNTSFLIYDINSLSLGSFYVWYNVDGGGIDPGTGSNPIEIPIATGDSAAVIATATADAITLANGGDSFTAVAVSNVITITNVQGGDATDSGDIDTGFGIVTTQQGTDFDYNVCFNITSTMDVDAGATGSFAIVGEGEISSTLSYVPTSGNDFTLDNAGSEDLGVAMYPDTRPIAVGASETYDLYSGKGYHAVTVYSDTFSSIFVQDNASGYQINSENVTWTNTEGTQIAIIRESNELGQILVGTNVNVIYLAEQEINVSLNQFTTNNLQVESRTVEIDGVNGTAKFWEDLQAENFHGVGATVANGGFAWGSAAEATGLYSFAVSASAKALAPYSIVGGIQSYASIDAIYSVCLGDNAISFVNGGVVLGGSNVINSGIRGVIIGANNTMTNSDPSTNGGVLIGRFNIATEEAFGIGRSLILGAVDAFAIGTSITNNDTETIKLGIGETWLDISNGDINATIGDFIVQDSSKGLILTSPDETKWRITVNDLGVLIVTAI